MNKQVKLLQSKEELIEQALEICLAKMQEAISQRGQCTIALAGGNTPKPLYESIATQNLPWDKIHVFWGDERYVAPDHQDSNQKMARQAWLDRVPIPPTNIHAMPTGAGDPEVDASSHDAHLREFFQVSPGDFPSFDLILLGMGGDAHTASLFPHTDALQISDRLITVGNKDGQPRLTFTVPLINQASCVIFLVAGADKQVALDRVFAENGDEMKYPSRLIQPKGELHWLLTGVNI
ncbi:MAG: 6-phosphogluconolactonase [Okeania sp. SIO2G4]|uniref:6-phosphogluconolactonase n=1 Tax=unclassified Okeania TaxID=2634635 RepID=UPI0013BAFA93|nr:MULTISPECIES: 6-phosphogluconolactonase [unclassified Okeania]NEP05576.1 6-phosphogluconolactonase [Okeania sp. SIO4D6]NEP39874.1 6-phosphogluconolactonase [Okeania sp. SIO2H7]NEP72102.1 6-phosphogluconolactonase [Okeania sp. SIO2G5]NEP92960.1 6-phosphogluconolactonase [Okeania sp. SIO2F5]NEQ91080.1 6-phosphogluconolactonase [Okeania sp. SIO2G4]